LSVQPGGVELSLAPFLPAFDRWRRRPDCTGLTNGLFTIWRQFLVMRAASVPFGLVLLSLLAGCGPAAPVAEVGIGVVSEASIPIFNRTPVDMVVSSASGRNCSVVNLDKGERYCRPRDRAPETPEFCTRSLGIPDCWDDP